MKSAVSGDRVNDAGRLEQPQMPEQQRYGAGIWHFATYVDRYATDGYGDPRSIIDAIDIAGQVRDLSVVDLNFPFFGGEFSNEQVGEALERNGLSVIGITPEIYTRTFAKGAFTNPDSGVRRLAHDLVTEAAGVVRHFGADYVKLWPGQDGWDYPFQVDHHTLWKASLDGVAELASENPDLNFVIEYKPREPRVHMSFDSVSRTLLGIESIGLPNVGILLDFGHSLFGGESPADAAQLAIDYGRLFGMDVNDNLRGWDDDLVAGTIHPVELFEFFYTLHKNDWHGVWQLDQFPFREDSVEAANTAIDFLKLIERALGRLDIAGIREAQANHDSLAALKLAQKALFSSY
jgi:xylose isomerase